MQDLLLIPATAALGVLCKGAVLSPRRHTAQAIQHSPSPLAIEGRQVRVK